MQALARESCLVWMTRFLGAWLVLETGPVCLGIWLLHIPLHRFLGPYLAVAVAPAVTGPFIYRINRRREKSPKRRARDMAIAATALIEIGLAALGYSAVTLGFISLNFAIINGIVAFLLSAPVMYLGGYRAGLAKATPSINADTRIGKTI